MDMIVGRSYFHEDYNGQAYMRSPYMPPMYGAFNSGRRKVYVDLDGVLFRAPFVDIYTFEDPNESVIAKIREMRAQGDIIVIWTSRTSGMMNRETPKQTVMELVAANLKKFAIPFDFIEVIDKPMYDVFVDDKAMNVEGFLQL